MFCALYKSNGDAKILGEGSWVMGYGRELTEITGGYGSDWGRICYTLGAVLGGVFADMYMEVYNFGLESEEFTTEAQGEAQQAAGSGQQAAKDN
jgi:hypothetical protein